MNVTIIGAGNMGRGIGTRLVAGGNDVQVIDRDTNPVDASTFDSLATPAETSAAEEIAELVPPGTPVVKAFNTTFAGTLVAGEVAGQQLDVLIAGDDAEAKSKVATLAESGGLRAVDVRPLRRARQLESLGFLHMSMQEALGTGFGNTVKLHW